MKIEIPFVYTKNAINIVNPLLAMLSGWRWGAGSTSFLIPVDSEKYSLHSSLELERQQEVNCL